MTRSTRYYSCLDCGGRHAEDEICPAGLERSAADGRMADAKLVPSGQDSEKVADIRQANRTQKGQKSDDAVTMEKLVELMHEAILPLRWNHFVSNRDLLRDAIAALEQAGYRVVKFRTAKPTPFDFSDDATTIPDSWGEDGGPSHG